MSQTLFDFKAKSGKGEEFDFGLLRGKTVLIVNTASKCGFTPQYEGLESLYKKYKDRGLAIIGFPCDQFAHQEPGNDAEIASFCSLTYGVTFPLMSKVRVNGKGTHPVFVFLKKRAPGLFKSVKWNFTKFLVSSDGVTIRRYAPTVVPSSLETDIEGLLP